MKIPAISKTFNKKTVLDLPELSLSEGRITAVIGPNGSGKTTFAKILAKVEKSDKKNDPLSGVSVGYMPQRSIAFRMSAEKNVLLNGSDKEKAAKLMETLNLASVAKERAKKLSGGETAKMALARILMGNYDLLILDEPSASMDMESTLACEELIKEHCRNTGCAVLLITHSLQQARRIADDVIYLKNGLLVEKGSASELLTAPKMPETRCFLDFYG